LTVDSYFTENAQFQTKACCGENGQVVKNHDDEGAPEQSVHPGE